MFQDWEARYCVPMRTEILIVGGGLSGLHTAAELARCGADFLLVEARDRLGGRILSRPSASSGDGRPAVPFDLGPTWFWPGQQRMEDLVRALGLEHQVFPQFERGDAVYEDPAGVIRRPVEGVSMAGSYRLNGGLGEIIDKLAQSIPRANIRRGAQVSELFLDTGGPGDAVRATMRGGDRQQSIECRQVVIALPPRLAVQSIKFEPPLPPRSLEELRRTPTWMAGQAKLVALYARPFWRDLGFSGDAVSHLGPLQEIHDMSPRDGGPYALFGFLGVPPGGRLDRDKDLRQASLAQLIRLFGSAAEEPLEVLYKDWACDPLTATAADHEVVPHPLTVRLPSLADSPWQRRIHWSGAETAATSERNNGYLEGALEASERTLERLSGGSFLG